MIDKNGENIGSLVLKASQRSPDPTPRHESTATFDQKNSKSYKSQSHKNSAHPFDDIEPKVKKRSSNQKRKPKKFVPEIEEESK